VSIGDVAVTGRWTELSPADTERKLNVDVDASTSVCDSTGRDWGLGTATLVVSIEFRSELGDIPLLKVEAEPGVPHSLSSPPLCLTSIVSYCLFSPPLYTHYFVGSVCFIVSGSIVIVEAQKGTKENDPCSGRGICNEKTGICDCFVTAADGSRGSGTASTAFLKAGFVSSDGDGNAGSRGDCGHVNSHCDNSMVKRHTINFLSHTHTHID